VTTWTNDEKELIDAAVERMGLVNIGYIRFLLKKDLGIIRDKREISDYIKGVKTQVKESVITPKEHIPIPVRRQKVKQNCREIINEIKDEIKNAEKEPLPVTYTEGGCSPILMLSDLHFGELIKLNGKVTFDLEIAKESFESIINQAIAAPELSGYNVDEFVVLLGGDIIDGELIYPTHHAHTDGGIFYQYKEAIVNIWEALKRIQSKFGFVKVYCAAGNHGRMSHHHAEMSNWDNVLYYSLALMAELDPCGIEIRVPTQMWMDFTVREKWNVHLRHIGVVQTNTAGPGRRMINWINNHDADLVFYGHYHNPELFSVGRTRVFKNGGLPPGNDYSEKLGFLEGPAQWLVGTTDSASVGFCKILTP